MGLGIFIGINQYENLNDLRFCENDAKTMFSVLEKLSEIKFKNKMLLIEPEIEPTRDNILKNFSEILSEAKPTDFFVFYFSGHGCEIDNKPFLLPKNFNEFSKNTSAIALESIIKDIDSIGIQKKLIILDCCNSGLHRGEKTAEKGNDTAFDRSVQTVGSCFDSIAILSASTVNEKARESETGKGHGHGIFTHSLINAVEYIAGKGEEKAQERYLESLYRLAYRGVLENPKTDQHPRFFLSTSEPILIHKSPEQNRKTGKTKTDQMGAKSVVKNINKGKKVLINLKKQNPQIVEEAVQEIVKSGLQYEDDLISLLGHSREEIRNLAAKCLGLIQSKKSIPYLIQALKSRDHRRHKYKEYTKEARVSLQNIGDDAFRAIVQYYQKTSEEGYSHYLHRHKGSKTANHLGALWEVINTGTKKPKEINVMIIETILKLKDGSLDEYLISEAKEFPELSDLVEVEFEKQFKNDDQGDKLKRLIIYVLKSTEIREKYVDIFNNIIESRRYKFIKSMIEACDIVKNNRAKELLKHMQSLDLGELMPPDKDLPSISALLAIKRYWI